MKSADDPRAQYLGVTGIIMREDYARERFTEAVNLIKQTIFGTTAIVLHRHDMLHAAPPFECLDDPALRADLDTRILDLITLAAYKVVTVVVDKRALREKYKVWQADPYHYCMQCLLERYVRLLQRAGSVGDVLAESRERRDNYRLSKAYMYVYKHGTGTGDTRMDAKEFQRHLPTELKLARKKENICGLQLADLIANPSCRELICRNTKQEMTADFGAKIVDILYRRKYRRDPYGKIEGWGTKWLP